MLYFHLKMHQKVLSGRGPPGRSDTLVGFKGQR